MSRIAFLALVLAALSTLARRAHADDGPIKPTDWNATHPPVFGPQPLAPDAGTSRTRTRGADSDGGSNSSDSRTSRTRSRGADPDGGSTSSDARTSRTRTRGADPDGGSNSADARTSGPWTDGADAGDASAPAAGRTSEDGTTAGSVGEVPVMSGVRTADVRTDAASDGPASSSAFQLHLDGGLELTGGQGAFAAAFRGRAGVGYGFGHGYVRPELSIGAMFSAGTISVSDPRALTGTLDLHARTYGPEAQIGLRFANGGSVDSRIFASVALLKTNLDSRLMYDRVPGVSGSDPQGLRLSVGANWADHVGSAIANDHCNGKDCGGALWFAFAPQQLEVVYERDAGTARYGAMLGWGI